MIWVSFSRRAGGPAAGHLACALRPDVGSRRIGSVPPSTREASIVRRRPICRRGDPAPPRPLAPGLNSLGASRGATVAPKVSPGVGPVRGHTPRLRKCDCEAVPERPERRPGHSNGGRAAACRRGRCRRLRGASQKRFEALSIQLLQSTRRGSGSASTSCNRTTSRRRIGALQRLRRPRAPAIR